jgi:3-oxoacyl-[acyl-carrier-protein] synthase III
VPLPGLVASDMIHDPEGVDLLTVEAGGSRRPATAETVAARAHYLHMDGQEVFRRAVRGVTRSVRRTLEGAGCSPDDVALFVPHQANARIVEAATARLGITADRTALAMARTGNTSAASVPIALAAAADEGRLSDGDLVLFSGYGAGMTWASALVRWAS